MTPDQGIPPPPQEPPKQGFMHTRMSRRAAIVIPASSKKVADFGSRIELVGKVMGAAMNQATQSGETVVQPATSNSAAPVDSAPSQITQPDQSQDMQQLDAEKPSEEKQRQPEPDNPEPIENYATADTLFQNSTQYAGTIKNRTLRLKTQGNIGIATIQARRMNQCSLVQSNIMRDINPADPIANIPVKRAMGEILREQGSYKIAEDLVGDADSQWHMDTAIHKGKRWQDGGKTDPDLDPKKDLEKAFKAARTTQGEELFCNWAELGKYAIAHYKTTGEYPTKAMKWVDDFFNEMLSEQIKSAVQMQRPGRSVYEMSPDVTKGMLAVTEQLANAYSALGEPMRARYALWDYEIHVPKSIELSQMKARVHQQVAKDALARGTERDLSMVNTAASDAISVIEAMPDGPKKDELMATVGVDMHMARALIVHKQSGHEPVNVLGALLRKHIMPTWDIINSSSNPLIKAKSLRVFAQRGKEIGHTGTSDFDAVLVELTHADFSGKYNTEEVVAEYRALAKDYVDHGYLEQAHAVLRRMERLTKGDKNIAAYAEALADVAKAEAQEIYAQHYEEKFPID